MLNLDDFSTLFVSGMENKKGRDEYAEKLEGLKRFYEKQIKEEREKAFKKGYESGKREAEDYFKRAFMEEKRKHEQKLKEEKETLRQEFRQLSFVLREENIKLGRKILETVSQSLEEIFEFLFIRDDNLPYLRDKLKEIIEDFKLESEPISVEVSQKLAEILNGIEGISVKVNEDIGEGDFVVKFADFTIVQSIKEKLSILREEIEREIKKSSQI